MSMTGNNKKKSKIDFSMEIDAAVNPKENDDEMDSKKEKKKPGRPKKGDVKKVSLSIPMELQEGIETAAGLLFNGNKTEYINSLIKKDLEVNLEKYEEFKKIKKMATE